MNTVSEYRSIAFQRWGLFAIIGLIFFHINGATFLSLGVVLPYMVEEMSWTWESAGLGFAILGLMTGLCSYVPAWIIRKFGIKASYGIGGAIMICGFVLMATTSSLFQYFLATCFLGAGFASCATVPAMHIINSWLPHKRSFAIGAYLTMGGLGGIPGPLIANAYASGMGSWRMHWWMMAASLLILTVLAVVFLKVSPDEEIESLSDDNDKQEKLGSNVFRTQISWQLHEVLRTHQYYILIAALAVVLLCTTTANAFAPAHMGMLGVSAVMAAGALSGHATVNALSRLSGGLLARHIDAKWLLVSALVAEFIAMLTLTVADNIYVITLFAFAEGYAFGMCYLAVVILVVNYFGKKHNLEILGTVHLFTTIATVGPWLAGLTGDHFGSFSPVFLGFAIIVFLVLIATLMMQPPRRVIPD
ncbi:MAG: OFA family oxalate/formate antiporter-like MFS transporter [Planctomycetota bacterium]|jgi:OFA family oxalate/formate antiporter-like MFS transporter